MSSAINREPDQAIPAMGTIPTVPLASLSHDPRNARTHSPEQIAQLKASIMRFGFTNPALYDDEGVLVAGHGRAAALAELFDEGAAVRLPNGATLAPGHIPAVNCTGWSEAERRAYALADNKLALNAGWDEDALRREITALMDQDPDIVGVAGFADDDVAALLRDIEDATREKVQTGNLSEEFLVPPFTVLSAREGWWQERKRQWIALGIDSEVGRGGNLVQRSLTERLCFIMGRHVNEVKAFIEQHRAAGLDDDAINALAIEQYGKTGEVDRAKGLGRSNGAPGGGGGGAWAERGGKRMGNGKRPAASFGQDIMKGEAGDALKGPSGRANAIPGGAAMPLDRNSGTTGTSIFDPVLCELAYRWFSPPGGSVLDPFAGGSVRGIVAGALGRRYLGIDLRPEQIEANRAQWPGVADRLTGDAIEPEWLVGDSRDILSARHDAADDLVGQGFDFLWTCPPYGNLEIYSDDPADISAMSMMDFDIAYEAIIARACARLADDRFAGIVVGDYRDKRGLYANFVSKTIRCFEAAGLALYNEAILVTAVGSLPIRAGKQFRATRKMGKTHQNVLIFCKGDPAHAAKACGPVDVSDAMAAVVPDDD